MSTRQIFIGVIGVLVVLGAAGLLFLLMSGPKKKDFLHLTEPRIVEKPSVTALIVNFNGDADTVLKSAFGSIFKVYYSLKGVPKGPGQPASVARYTNFEDMPITASEEELKSIPWNGYVAMPVPDGITQLPDNAASGEYPVRLETLEYGTVAEIVHFGPYEEEVPNIEKLKNFIAENGYEIAGMHEEEYIKGPGMPFANPKKFITIIRYQVKKK